MTATGLHTCNTMVLRPGNRSAGRLDRAARILRAVVADQDGAAVGGAHANPPDVSSTVGARGGALHRGGRSTRLRVPTHRPAASADARRRCMRAHDGRVRSRHRSRDHRSGPGGGTRAARCRRGHAADVLWAAVLIAVIVPLAVAVVRRMLRGQLGADVIALLAIAGSLLLGSSRQGWSSRSCSRAASCSKSAHSGAPGAS